jgi:Mg-chelatase subunit ChlD
MRMLVGWPRRKPYVAAYCSMKAPSAIESGERVLGVSGRVGQGAVAPPQPKKSQDESAAVTRSRDMGGERIASRCPSGSATIDRVRALALFLALPLLSACGSKTPLRVGDRGEPRGDASVDATTDATTDGSLDARTDSVPFVDVGADACAPVVVASTVSPTVIVLIDQSGSMAVPVSSGLTRWTLLREALVGGEGLVTRLQRRVRFGVAFYTARSEFGEDGGPPIGPCPDMTAVPPTLDNLAAIRDTYDRLAPIEDTPTGDAIDAAREALSPLFRPDLGPTIFVLATDGEPDTCAELDPSNGQDEAVAATRRTFDAGIRTFVVSLGEGDVSRRHLTDMANAGLGTSDAAFWEASDIGGLRTALDEIVRTDVACTLTLTQAVEPSLACLGDIRLNGRPLLCDGADGFSIPEPTTLVIAGEACRELSEIPSSRVEARFPCEALR